MTANTALLLTLVVPLLGAVLIALAGRWPNLRETVTMVTALTLFGLVIRVLMGLNAGEEIGVELVTLFSGVPIAFNTEPLSILFAMIASGLWIVTSIYAIGYMRGTNEKQQTRFYVCFAIALFGAMGVAFSANLLTLFIFYEVLTISTYPLVTHKGDDKAKAGGRTYLGILMTTSIVFLLPAIIWTYAAAGTLDFVPGGILEGQLAAGSATLLLMLFLFGVAKAAVMPVHRWLPAAMVAPTPVSALLHAVAVVKAGVFTLIKVVIYIFGTDYLAEVPYEQFAVYIAGFTVVAASCIALRQTNIKRLLAYSTIGQLSYIIMATMALAPFSEIGAAIHIAAHAFGKITLFFTAGAIYVASKKTEITQLNGIGWRMPYTMTAFAIGALSMIGVPPTAGFVSKWFIIAGAFQLDNYFVLVVLILSTALNAAYFLPIIFNAFFKPEDVTPVKDHAEAPTNMVIALSVTATLTLLFFFFNGPVLDLETQIVGGMP
ncbi:proton-conducting transporter membrane subunit [Pseudohongiella sp. SYSU M77423]|uniref:proton-conducting transporter transmembrane domain-containing protein n=1 Tax=unclassified Pseudohongiella TaxID=2629611 RepID=UPI001F3CA644|nr:MULTISPECIES: proton-conducting transporter membrane subunit [unclassified Pseudohongiella]MDH7943208.1 proton-conducting transporter membrane subunit [Pseudohongiella sp. SYSU M77423]MEC8860064.1 proton-conducting transporter membrane subunit [Pseudomonadota bacterium]